MGINANKTKRLVVSKEPKRRKLEVRSKIIEQVSEFNNVGVQITRRIFEPKRNDNGEWRRLRNVELHSLYRSPNIVSH